MISYNQQIHEKRIDQSIKNGRINRFYSIENIITVSQLISYMFTGLNGKYFFRFRVLFCLKFTQGFYSL